MLNLLLFSALMALLPAMGAAPLVGQAADSVPRSAVDPTLSALEVRLRAGAAFMGNFLQAPEGTPRTDVGAGTADVQLALPVASSLALSADVGGTLYTEYDPSWNVGGGVGWSATPHDLRGIVRYRARTPRMEVGDSLGFADVLHLGGTYQVRPIRSVQLEALADYFDESYGRNAARDNTFFDAGGAIRYRGLGYSFSPEVGGSFGSRDVRTDTEDFDQRTLWVTFRSIPTPPLYLSLRYRNRLRDYGISDPVASNFDREDRRHQITFTADLTVQENLAWTVYYSFEHANSTKPSRRFRTHYLWTGLTYRIR